MLSRQKFGWPLVIAMVVSVAGTFTMAQEGPRPGRDRGAERGGDDHGGDWEARRADMQRRMGERMKETLSVSDEEWGLIQPMLEKVQNLQMQARGGGLAGGRRGGPDAWPAMERQTNPVVKAQQELRAVLDHKDASASQIKDKLDALRNAREKHKQELTQAQQDLREVLNQRQEAQLVMMGILD